MGNILDLKQLNCIEMTTINTNSNIPNNGRTIGPFTIYKSNTLIQVKTKTTKYGDFSSLVVCKDYVVAYDNKDLYTLIPASGLKSGPYDYVSEDEFHINGTKLRVCKVKGFIRFVSVPGMTIFRNNENWNEFKIFGDGTYAALGIYPTWSDYNRQENIKWAIVETRFQGDDSYLKLKKDVDDVLWLYSDIFALKINDEWCLFKASSQKTVFSAFGSSFESVERIGDSPLVIASNGSSWFVYNQNIDLICRSYTKPILVENTCKIKTLDETKEDEIICHIDLDRNVLGKSSNDNQRMVQNSKNKIKMATQINENDSINAGYCYWGEFSLKNEEAVIEKKHIKSYNHTAERIIIIDKGNKKILLCGANPSKIKKNLYFKVAEQFEMTDKLKNFLDIYYRRGETRLIDIYEYNLYRAGIGESVYNIIKEKYDYSQRQTENSTIFDTIKTIHSVLVQNNIADQNFADSILTLFPQLIDDEDIYPAKFTKIKEVQSKLLHTLNNNDLNFKERMIRLGISDESIKEFTIACRYYKKIKHYDTRTSIYLSSLDLGYTEEIRNDLISYASKSNRISQLKKELLLLLCKELNIQLNIDDKANEEIKPKTYLTSIANSNEKVFNQGAIFVTNYDNQPIQINGKEGFRYNSINRNGAKHRITDFKNCILLYIDQMDVDMIERLHNQSQYTILGGEDSDRRLDQTVDNSRNCAILKNILPIYIILKDSDSLCTLYDKVELESYNMEYNDTEQRKLISFTFRSILRFKEA